MKKCNYVLLIMAMLVMVSCTGMTTSDMPISSDAVSKAVCYAAGKGMGYGINKLSPEADKELGGAWKNFMERVSPMQTVPSDEVIHLYTELTMILSSHVNDPYGLLGDLSAMLMIFNAEFSGEGTLIKIDSVPVIYLRLFELGYIGGKRIVER